MHRWFFILSFLICFSTVVNCGQYTGSDSRAVYWQTLESQVLSTAQRANMPIVAVFLSDPSCPWSLKLQNEVIENSVFREKVGSEAILWQVVVKGEAGDKELRERYRVHTCPLILLMDPRGKEFARLEYSPLDAHGYAAKIHGLIDNFQELCLALDREAFSFEEEKWQELYQKAKNFSATCFKQVILERGLQRETGTFFHIEKYASLLEKYKRKHPRVLKAKTELLKLDPDNRMGTHFKVAALEFDKIRSSFKETDRVEKPLMPLLRFVHKFGKTDKENLWKAELMIAQYLFAKDFVADAVEHAEASYLAAPDAAKSQIAEMLCYIKRE